MHPFRGQSLWLHPPMARWNVATSLLLTAFHQMPVVSHRALSPELLQALLHTSQCPGKTASEPFSWPASPWRRPVPLLRTCGGTAASCPGGTACSLKGTWRGAVALHFLGLPLSVLGQGTWGGGNGGKSRPAVSGTGFCPTSEGW